jgi:hypothetical protein
MYVSMTWLRVPAGLDGVTLDLVAPADAAADRSFARHL